MLIILCLLYLIPGAIIVFGIYGIISKLLVDIDNSKHENDIKLYFMLFWLLHAYGFYKACFASFTSYKPDSLTLIYIFINDLVSKIWINSNMVGGYIELLISITIFSALAAIPMLFLIKLYRVIRNKIKQIDF